jgi:hypothetical protein
MSTDSELLHLAAKAAGFYVKSELVNQNDEFIGLRVKPGVSAPRVTISFWNPLTDDGDALRLAVSLQMALSIDAPTSTDAGAAIATCPTKSGLDMKSATEIVEKVGELSAATRRAIVRAAAAIGRMLK